MDPTGPSRGGIRFSLTAAANVANTTDARDVPGMVELLRHLKELDAQLRSSASLDAVQVCAVGMRITESLITKRHTTPEELLLWVGRLLHALGVTLDVEIPEAWSDPSLAPQPFVASGAHLGHLHMAKPDGLRLGEILVQMLILDAPDVARALKFQEETGCRLGEALVMLGLITQKGLEAALRIQQRKRGPRD